MSVKSLNLNSLPEFTGVWFVISWSFTLFRFPVELWIGDKINDLTFFPPALQIDQLKQELSKKESELLALQTKLETLSNQNSDCKQHIEVLKESLTAKEQRAAILQTEVLYLLIVKCNRNIGFMAGINVLMCLIQVCVAGKLLKNKE